MKKIRVTRGGCGIAYTDAHGVKRHALKMPEDGPFECDDAQADRLVRLGVAAYVTAKAPEAQQEPEENEDQDPQEPAKTTGYLDAAELEGWEYNQLKKLAADMGVTPKGKKKADLIAAITAVEVTPDDEVEPDDEDDNPPELGAADPE